MKLWIGLATPNQPLTKFFGEQKIAAVPKDVLKRGFYTGRGISLKTGAYSPSDAASPEDLERFLIRETGSAEYCILLLDEDWEPLAANIRQTCFVIVYNSKEADHNHQNFLQKVMASSLRSFGQLIAKFEKGRDAELLNLPLRNFHAEDLAEIQRLVSEEPLSQRLNEDIEACLVRLRKRVRPRKKSEYKTLYAVDDRKRFFKYGHERHSIAGTGGEHRPYCILSANFRFGRQLDIERHYNVSDTESDNTTVEGEFSNCHSVIRHEKRKTHLNMFANDMYY